MPVIVSCSYCGKKLKRKPSRLKIHKTFFCSYSCKGEFQKGKPTWNKGKKLPPLTEEHRRKISMGVRRNKNVKRTQFRKGHKQTQEIIRKRIETRKKRGSLCGKRNGMYGRTGKLNPNWKGGISYWRKKYYNSIPYKRWQRKVFKRDAYRCQLCGCTKGKGKVLHAHHIKPFAEYPSLRLDVNNGVTLCCECHSLIHSKKLHIGEVLSIEETNDEEEMVDIEVKDNNNFFADGILVHNSATPYREDSRTDMIFAMTGLPVGMDWHELLETQVITKPSIYLYILRDQRAKMKKLVELLTIPVKTIIFCDSIDLGQRISQKFGIPHVYGATRNRIDIIKESEMTVVSRVGDEGISLPAIERVIEVDFLFGSRRQEGQRLGRLFHAEKEGEHIILMTDEEFEKYEKRLYAIYEKGFRIDVRRG